jgi:hypothetical protein
LNVRANEPSLLGRVTARNLSATKRVSALTLATRRA